MRTIIITILSLVLFSSQYVSAAEVNVTAVRLFVECVTNLTTNYDYVVEENGSLVLQAAFNQSSPSQKQDEDAVFNCLVRVNYQFYLAVDDNSSEEYKLHDSRPLTRDSADDIIGSGLVPPAPPHWSQSYTFTAGSISSILYVITGTFLYTKRLCNWSAKNRVAQNRKRINSSLLPSWLAFTTPLELIT